MKRLQPYLPAIGIFCLAFVVRLVYNLVVAQNYVPQFDSQVYEKLALHLSQYGCFCFYANRPTTARAPLWPALIAGIYGLFGFYNFYVRLFLCMIDAGTCVLVYLWARDIFGKRIAIVAGIIAGIYPNLFIYTGWLYSEAFYTFLITSFSYTLYLTQRTSKQRWVIASGIFLGLLSLTRPNGPIVLFLVLLWACIVVWAKMLSWRTAFTSVIVMALVSLAIVLPWTIRNYVVSRGQLIPVATGDGIVLLGAYNDIILDNTPYRGIWFRPSLVNPQLVRIYGGCDAICEAQRDVAYKKAAFQWIDQHHHEMIGLLGFHLTKMWTPTTPEGDLPMSQFPDLPASQFVMSMIGVMSIPIFILAAFGLIVTWRRKWQHLIFAYLVIVTTVGECLYFYGSSRFRAPIEPLLVLLAAGAIWWVTQKEPVRWMFANRGKK